MTENAKYNPKEIEPKWQEFWAKKSELSEAIDDSDKPKFYCLDMFPYPSGAGLHVGHVENYTATDIYSRFKRMNGCNVLHPMGWDAFGLPAENFAIKNKIHPDKSTHDNIKNFTAQIKRLGMSYDWSREIDTSSPEYYKWTQWFFLFLYKNGLAYKKKAKANWCKSCKTVVANEQVVNGKCERCGGDIIQKDLDQWFFKITDFIEDADGENGKVSGLINGLDKIDWPNSTVIAQKNWIGKSEGAVVKFQISNNKFQINSKSKIKNLKMNDSSLNTGVFKDRCIEVFTTRVDTIFGCTYVVLAPESKLVSELKNEATNLDEIEKYITDTKKKTDLERMENKEKTGVAMQGVMAVNPFNGEEVPIYVADYVIGTYGTGAVMAVPAHDERDWEFAKKYDLPIKQSITPDYENYKETVKTLSIFKNIHEVAESKGIKFWLLGGLSIPFYSNVVYRRHSDIDLIAKDEESLKRLLELFEELGFEKVREKKISETLTNFIYKKDDIEIDIGPNQGELGLKEEDFEKDIKVLAGFNARVLSRNFMKSVKEYQLKSRDEEKDKLDLEYINGKVFTDYGVVVNSDRYSGLTSLEAKEKMTAWLEKEGKGERKVNYRLRDWLVSRQRYWGAPIPIIYCDKCGEVPVPESDLPVTLPTDVDFKPTGESPLAISKSFHNVVCPSCGAQARRESDTMDTFVCSSWYYLRFADPKNETEFADKKSLEKWLPVDLYMGGAEHTVLHLLYARFFTKALAKYGYINFDEPFLKLRHQGMIMAEDGRKMSKSLGNVVNPDDVIAGFGADALRIYEMFMGPIEEMKAWSMQNVNGPKNFLDKIWKLQYKIPNSKLPISNKIQIPNDQNSKLVSLIHKTIKKVGEDIENFRFNTAVSQLMILTNAFEKEEKISLAHYTTYIILLSPFAPHIAEELWQKLGHTESIFKESWPEYDDELIKDETINLVLQVNGRLRDMIETDADIQEEAAKKIALESEKIKKHINGKEIKKIIFVKGKLINIVI